MKLDALMAWGNEVRQRSEQRRQECRALLAIHHTLVADCHRMQADAKRLIAQQRSIALHRADEDDRR